MWQKTADMNKPLDIFKASADFEKKIKGSSKNIEFYLSEKCFVQF